MMPPTQIRVRPGISLIEVLLVVGLIAALASTIVAILFSVGEERLLQQDTAIVEQSAAEILHTLSFHLRHAERVIDPGLSSSGTVLALQTSSGSTDPMIIGLSSGRLMLAQRARIEPISSSQVIVQSFRVGNTSLSARSQSVALSFTLTQANTTLPAKTPYSRTFRAAFSLFPADATLGNACGCAAPTCLANQYRWNICTSSVCGPGPVTPVIEC